jgi:hypothetical protein
MSYMEAPPPPKRDREREREGGRITNPSFCTLYIRSAEKCINIGDVIDINSP